MTTQRRVGWLLAVGALASVLLTGCDRSEIPALHERVATLEQALASDHQEMKQALEADRQEMARLRKDTEMVQTQISAGVCTQSFVLIDKKGRTRVRLEVGDDWPVLRLTDEYGTASATLEVDKDRPVLKFEDENGMGDATPIAQKDGPGLTEMRDKVTFITGSAFSVNITDCRGGKIIWNVVTGSDSQGKSVTQQFPHSCSDIISIAFGVPKANLERKILKLALSIGNGELAYDIAFNSNRKNDPSMKVVSEDPRLGQAIADVQAARKTYVPLQTRVSDAEARLAYLQDAGGQTDDRVLVVIRSQRDAAMITYKKAQAALDAICKDILQKAFPVTAP